jgi:hypothetical protein
MLLQDKVALSDAGRSLRCLVRWQRDAKGSTRPALGSRRPKTRSALMFCDNSLRKPKSKTCPGNFARDVGFEESRGEVVRNAFPIVGNKNVNSLTAAPYSN